MAYPQNWQPVASAQLTPQLILARWLVLCYDRPGAEGNTWTMCLISLSMLAGLSACTTAPI